jgi:hypothetical protein
VELRADFRREPVRDRVLRHRERDPRDPELRHELPGGRALPGAREVPVHRPAQLRRRRLRRHRPAGARGR